MLNASLYRCCASSKRLTLRKEVSVDPQFIKDTILRRMAENESEDQSEDELPVPDFQRVTISSYGAHEVGVDGCISLILCCDVGAFLLMLKLPKVVQSPCCLKLLVIVCDSHSVWHLHWHSAAREKMNFVIMSTRCVC